MSQHTLNLLQEAVQRFAAVLITSSEPTSAARANIKQQLLNVKPVSDDINGHIRFLRKALHWLDAKNPDLQRYSFLTSYSMRTNAEEAEMKRLQKKLLTKGIDPGWTIVPREKAAWTPRKKKSKPSKK